MIWLIEILTVLARRTVSDRVLRDKAFDIAKNLKYNGYQNVLASMIYNFFDKKPGEGSGFKSPIKLNQHPLYLATQELVEELHKAISRNLKREKCIHLLKTIFRVLILQICN